MFQTMEFDYFVDDFVHIKLHIEELENDKSQFKFGSNIGLKDYVVCELLELVVQNRLRNELFGIKVKVL